MAKFNVERARKVVNKYLNGRELDPNEFQGHDRQILKLAANEINEEKSSERFWFPSYRERMDQLYSETSVLIGVGAGALVYENNTFPNIVFSLIVGVGTAILTKYSTNRLLLKQEEKLTRKLIDSSRLIVALSEQD